MRVCLQGVNPESCVDVVPNARCLGGWEIKFVGSARARDQAKFCPEASEIVVVAHFDVSKAH